MLSNFSTLKELNDLRSGEASPLEMISPAASLLYAGLTGETTLGSPAKGPLADGLPDNFNAGAVAEVASSYFPGYSAFKKGTKEGGVTVGGPGPALAQFLGGSFAGGPVDIAKAREMGERDKRADMSPRERIRDDAETLIEQSRSAGLGDPSPQIVQEIEWAAAMGELTAQKRPYRERLKLAAELLKLKTGNDRFVGFEPRYEKEAQDVYNDLREQLLHDLNTWQARLDRELDAKLEGSPAR